MNPLGYMPKHKDPSTNREGLVKYSSSSNNSLPRLTSKLDAQSEQTSTNSNLKNNSANKPLPNTENATPKALDLNKDIQNLKTHFQKPKHNADNLNDPRYSSEYKDFTQKKHYKINLKPVLFEADRHTIIESPKISLVISELSSLTTYDNLRDFFNDFGDVSNIILPRDTSSGMTMGIALIEFSHSHSHHPIATINTLFSNLDVVEKRFHGSKLHTNFNGKY
ncbi:hypothetical protein BB561_000892 [Smittium simulii]|uniref:RRM domain-containing protein n=1 Tax=Smittium simulii TaxID=133385 RepID=A0A2T9YX26_9FUNG|nr:hypothetical protein BB561_006929 [Smittium simulii]PVU96891.1 hypothetical protein BB561_000892 [Smittium simulii]